MTDPINLDANANVVASALAAAEEHALVLDHQADGHLIVVAHPTDRQIQKLDLEQYLPAPTRQRGTIRALTAEGFVDAFAHRARGADDSVAAVYADIDNVKLVAVLNDDEAGATGWGDHRITYQPQHTPEWNHWVKRQGLHPQDKFAEALEGGELEIRNPSATVMLDLAQTFHASTTAKFKQAGRLKDGRTQLVYEEEIEAKAGEGEGIVDIPDSFTIEVRPFYGAEPVEVRCRLRYRLERGTLAIGYTIIRPDEIVRDSFVADVVGHVREALAGFPVVEAIPADPITPGR